MRPVIILAVSIQLQLLIHMLRIILVIYIQLHIIILRIISAIFHSSNNFPISSSNCIYFLKSKAKCRKHERA